MCCFCLEDKAHHLSKALLQHQTDSQQTLILLKFHENSQGMTSLLNLSQVARVADSKQFDVLHL